MTDQYFPLELVSDAILLSYRNEMPNEFTLSKPFFQTRVTSQALVACNRHERNADTALPPTAKIEGQ